MKDRSFESTPLFMRNLRSEISPLRFPSLDSLPWVGVGQIETMAFESIGVGAAERPVAGSRGPAPFGELDETEGFASLDMIGGAANDAAADERSTNIVEISVQAYAEGHARGRAEGLAAAEEEMRAAASHLLHAASVVREHRPKTVLGLEAELVELALHIAQRVLRAEVSARGHEVAMRLAHAGIARLGDCERVTVRLSEADHGSLAPPPQSLQDRIVYISDPTLTRGDAVVESQLGRVDARLVAQLDELRTALEAPAREGVPLREEAR